MDPDALLDSALNELDAGTSSTSDHSDVGEPAAKEAPSQTPSPTEAKPAALTTSEMKSLEDVQSYQRPFYAPTPEDLKDENNTQEALTALFENLVSGFYDELQRLSILQDNKRAAIIAYFPVHIKSKDVKVDVGSKTLKISLTNPPRKIFEAELPDNVTQDDPWTITNNDDGDSVIELNLIKTAEGVWEVPFDYPFDREHPAILSDADLAKFDDGLAAGKAKAAAAGKKAALGVVSDAAEEETEPVPSDESELTGEQHVEMAFRALQSRDFSRAVHHLRVAAIHHDHASAGDLLSRLYGDSESPVANEAKARSFVEMAAHLGSPLAMLRLADRYRNADWEKDEKSFEQAFRLYQRAAIAGHPHGMLQCTSVLLQLANNAQSVLAPPPAEERAELDAAWTGVGLTRARILRLAFAWLYESARRGYTSAYVYLFRVGLTSCPRIGIPVHVRCAMTALRLLQLSGGMGELTEADQELYKKALPLIEALSEESKAKEAAEKEKAAKAKAAATPSLAAPAAAAAATSAPKPALPVARVAPPSAGQVAARDRVNRLASAAPAAPTKPAPAPGKSLISYAMARRVCFWGAVAGGVYLMFRKSSSGMDRQGSDELAHSLGLIEV